MLATISPQSLPARLSQPGVRLIDVRTPAEFRGVHLEGAENVPLEGLDPGQFAGSSEPILVVCQRGGRSRKACEQLIAAGVADVTNVEGGTLACLEAGLPAVEGRQAVSLERQVRIAAGSLVVLGVGLGVFVHAAWLGLAAFVGAGLVFAGVTDTCGMGMLLARMPWNQTSD